MMSAFFLSMAATGAAVTTLVTRQFLTYWSSRQAKAKRLKYQRCERWLIGCAAGTTDDGAFYPPKMTMCTVFAQSECSAFFSTSPGDQVAPAYTHVVAGCEMGSSELAAYVNAAGWGTLFVVFSLFRKVCVLKQRPTEAEGTGRGVQGTSAGRSTGRTSLARNPLAFPRVSVPLLGERAENLRSVASGRASSRSRPRSAEVLDSEVGGVDGADGSGDANRAKWVSFDLAEGEELKDSSFMPMVIAGSGGRRIRRWRLEDLVSRADEGRARVVGWGGFAQVALTTMADGKLIAVKTMERWNPIVGSQDKFLDREIELLKECGAHPNVVDSLGYIKTTSRVLLMMPIIPTDIETMIQDHPLSDAATQNFIRQLLSALEHLHEKGIVHRDVKPENLLVENETTLLLADFGISKKISPDKEYLSNFIGSMPYMAPEMFPVDEGDVRYTAKVDLWAAGVTAHEMLTTKTPFRSVKCGDAGAGVEEAKGGTAGVSRKGKEQSADLAGNDDSVERANILAGRATFDPSLSPEAFNFIGKLLAGDVDKRPSAHEAAEHEWLGGTAEAACTRAQASTAVRAREAELKSGRAQIVASRRWFPW